MKTKLTFSLFIFFSLLLVGCKEESIETIIPENNEADRTVSVILTNIPAGLTGSSTYIFSVNNEGNVFAVTGAVAKENEIVKLQPLNGIESFSVVAFIPEKAGWTPDKSFTAGQYSRITGVVIRDGVYVTSSWANVSDLGSAPTTGMKSSIEADLTLNASSNPAVTDFQKGSILTLDANVTDNIKSSVASLTYSLDGTTLKTYTTSPFKFQFNTIDVSLGSHMLYMTATNGLGHTSSDSIKIFITTNTNVGPSVTLSGVINNGIYTRQEVRTITANATDPDDGIDKVEFKIANTLVYTDNASPFSFLWDTFDNSVGNVIVEVTAYDKSGQARSDVVNVTLKAPTNYFPRVAITSPATGASFTVGQTISLAANASDTEGDPIANVTFYYKKATTTPPTFTSPSGATLIGAPDTTSPYSVDWNTTGLSLGDYYIIAYASDNSANSTYRYILVTIK